MSEVADGSHASEQPFILFGGAGGRPQVDGFCVQ